MKKSCIISIIITCFMVISFFGCGDKGASEKSGLKKIIVAEIKSEFWLPVYLAKPLGFFKEEGLDIEFVAYKDGPIAFQGMHAGNSQFCLLSTEPVLRAYDQGKESKIILSALKSKPYMFVGRKGIKNIKDLKGKIVFAGMPGSAPYSFAQSLLMKAGLNPDKDVTWANMEYGASLGALEKGTIDGLYLRPTAKNDVKKIEAVILADMSDPAQHKKVYGSDKYEATIVTVTKDYAEKNPEIIQNFVNAVVKAIIWQAKNSDELVAKTAAPFFEGIKMDAEFINNLRPFFSLNGDISKEGHDTIMKFCLETKIVSKPIPYEKIIDTSYVKKAYKEFSK
ncbi:MAG: ABC transporter substrate-binding protein [Candidatus Omnitrophica bacterium]|nr:ABC transporter substrate-binding protein [Candidatus Omnitrophota bacterium]